MGFSIDTIIGDRIIAIECLFGRSGEPEWLDTCLTYVTLENNGVINLPGYGTFDIINVDTSSKAEPMIDSARENVIGQAIVDVLYACDDKLRPYRDWVAFLCLSNGFVLHEFRMEPKETGLANLWLFSPEEFVLEAQDRELNLVSFSRLLK